MSIIINTLSACSFFTEIYFNDIKLSSATSFAFSYKGQAFLVTNYHVAFGKNPHSQSVLNQYGAIPNKIVFYYYADNNELMSQTIRFAEYENPFGFFTSEKGEILDIAVLKLNDFNGICINEAHKYNTRLTYRLLSLSVLPARSATKLRLPEPIESPILTLAAPRVKTNKKRRTLPAPGNVFSIFCDRMNSFYA